MRHDNTFILSVKRDDGNKNLFRNGSEASKRGHQATRGRTGALFFGPIRLWAVEIRERNAVASHNSWHHGCDRCFRDVPSTSRPSLAGKFGRQFILFSGGRSNRHFGLGGPETQGVRVTAPSCLVARTTTSAHRSRPSPARTCRRWRAPTLAARRKCRGGRTLPGLRRRRAGLRR